MIAALLTVLAGGAPLAAQDPPPARPFHGIVVDKVTGEPVPATSVKVWGPYNEPDEIVRTDRFGRFVTRAAFSSRPIYVTPWDDSSSSTARVRVDHVVAGDDAEPPEPVVCRLEVGTRHTFDVRDAPLGCLDGYRFELRERGIPPCASARVQKVRLHEEQTRWARPSPRGALAGKGTFHLLAGDGFSGASVDVPAVPDGKPLVLRRRPLGGVAGQVRRSLPTPVPVVDAEAERHSVLVASSAVKLVFTPLPVEGATRVEFVRKVDIERPFRVGWIEPGRWRVEARSAHYEPASTEIEVVAGVDAQLDLGLGRPAPTGSLRIQIAEHDGDVEDWHPLELRRLSVGVRSERPGGARYSIDSSGSCHPSRELILRRVERDGRRIFEVVIPGVPIDTYRVVVTADRVLDSRVMRVRAGETARFTFAREEPSIAYGFKAFNEHGKKVDSYCVTGVEPGEVSPLSFLPGRGGVHAYGLPDEGPLEWCLHKIGHRRVYGDRSDFVRGEDGHWATVRLVPGFAMRLRARLADGSPASGVAVQFAGATFVTDAAGLAVLGCAAPKPAPNVRFEGFEVVAGDVNAAGGFKTGCTRSQLDVTLEPSGR